MLDLLINFFGLESFTSNQLTVIATIASVVAAFTSIISLIGIIFAFKGHILKSKTKFTGYLKIKGSYNNSEKFISYLTLDNLRDRSEVIYGIYLEIDYGKYICLEDLKDKPIVIPPFDVVVREFGFVDFYHIAGQRVNIRHFLKSNRSFRIVLSISSGKYTFKPRIEYWTPEEDWYFNKAVHSIKCSRLKFGDTYYGNDLLYLIVEKEKNTPVYSMDVKRGKFEGFDIEHKCLRDKKAFKMYLKSLEHNKDREFYVLDKKDLCNNTLNSRGEIFIPYTGLYEVYLWYSFKAWLNKVKWYLSRFYKY